MMFNDTVTLYNRLPDESYKRTELPGVYWYDTASYSASVQRHSDDASIIIPYRSGYVDAFDGTGETWTLKPGDLIVQGIGPEIERAKDLDDPRVISRVIKATVDSALAHWEVTVK